VSVSSRPDLIGSSRERYFFGHSVVSDGQYSHAQTLILYLMLLRLTLLATHHSQTLLEIILALETHTHTVIIHNHTRRDMCIQLVRMVTNVPMKLGRVVNYTCTVCIPSHRHTYLEEQVVEGGRVQ
jgi:hypothetical protein